MADHVRTLPAPESVLVDDLGPPPAQDGFGVQDFGTSPFGGPDA